MKRLILILCTVFSISAYAQNADEMATYKVHISTGEKSIIAEIRPVGSAPTAEANKLYYWFSSNTIKQTQGGYSGHLLNGPYKEFYLNKNLKEQGEFKNGLKSGVWKNWDRDGKLTDQVSWDKGVKSGEFKVYNSNGTVYKRGTYNNDVLNGRQLTYTTGVNGECIIQTVNYKNGKSVSDTTKPTIWYKLNIFRKKSSANK